MKFINNLALGMKYGFNINTFDFASLLILKIALFYVVKSLVPQIPKKKMHEVFKRDHKSKTTLLYKQ